MGAWGTAIFSDDTALDIRNEWRNAILDGLSPEEATARLVRSFDDHLGEDEDSETSSGWRSPQLSSRRGAYSWTCAIVRDRALQIIEGGGDVGRWREDADEVTARQRARVLERLASKLRGPQPKSKRIRRPRSLSIPFEPTS
jgi:hypothetical protein